MNAMLLLLGMSSVVNAQRDSRKFLGAASPLDSCPQCELRQNTDPDVDKTGSCGSCNWDKTVCKYPPKGSKSYWCPPCQLAKMWKENVGNDCWQAMAIALGEGINPFHEGTLNDTDTAHFCVDQVAWDQYDTLGPWQVKTVTVKTGTGQKLERRIEEATTS